MNKKQIIDVLGRKDYLSQLKTGELDFFHFLLQRLAEHDYQGMIQLARRENLDLGPAWEVLEQNTIKRLQSGESLRGYEFSLLIDMFGGHGRGSGVESADKDAPEVDEDKLRSIYLELSGARFGDKHAEKIKYYISLWGLDHIYAYIFDKGVRTYLNNRYGELTGNKDSDLNIHEILKEMPAPALLEEEKLIEDYMFDEGGGAASQDGLKEDLQKEKSIREKAEKLLQRLYERLQKMPLDHEKVLDSFKDLHMERRVRIIERAGIGFLRKHLQNNAVDGAGAAARRFNLALPEILEDQDRQQALRTINNSLFSQSRNSEKGRHFLRWEGVLDHNLFIEQAHCYTVHGGYLMISVTPIEDVEHFLFGHYPLIQDRHQLIITFMRHYLKHEKIARAAGTVIQEYMEKMKGAVRMRNAIRIAGLAFPVVLTVAVMVGWVYNLTIGQLGEGTLLSVAIMIIGEAIAARNGYSMEVKPEDNEAVPEYACRDHGVLRLRASAAQSRNQDSGD